MKCKFCGLPIVKKNQESSSYGTCFAHEGEIRFTTCYYANDRNPTYRFNGGTYWINPDTGEGIVATPAVDVPNLLSETNKTPTIPVVITAYNFPVVSASYTLPPVYGRRFRNA